MFIFILYFVDFAHGHGSMIMPPTRNAIDAKLSPWSNGKHAMTGWIEPYNCKCTNGTDICNNGQSCFWFSQGCTIGCKSCDGNGSRLPNFDHCPGESIAPTLTDPKYRTVNQGAESGSEADFTKFNPWRAPGRAPVFDACGMAGGVDHEVFNAGAYNTTKFAKQGDLGSKVLPYQPSGTVWKRGDLAKVRWQLTAAHGGGYQYRLCPLKSELTEDCFQKMPLKYASPNKQLLVFKNSTQNMIVEGRLVPDSVTGTGDWMMNPIPYGDKNCGACCDRVMPEGEHCSWKCPGCGAPWYSADGACPVDCAHYGLPHGGSDSKYNAAFNVTRHLNFQEYAVEDTLEVPENIPAGEYVLGWRWDCEATSQIWSSCADITIV